MTDINVSKLHRTTKLEVDSGVASTFTEAQQIADNRVLQIYVAEDVENSDTRQSMLLTAINAGHRAFNGGVKVHLQTQGTIRVPWGNGLTLAQAVEKFGGTVAEPPASIHPTLVIGHPNEAPRGSIVLYPTWENWAGAVTDRPEERLPETSEFSLAGILAAALGVSEAFQHARGSATVGRRSIGLSLWQPDGNWRDKTSQGPADKYLPTNLWMIGLGHLGQAYAWALGLLPYPPSANVKIMLQDYDDIIEANVSTGMLTSRTMTEQKKTRAVAHQLESLGFQTYITERAFNRETSRQANEPGIAISGLDSPTPRRHLEQAGFDLIVDAGIGGKPQDYDDILTHAFPSGIQAETAWSQSRAQQQPSAATRPAYNALQNEITAREPWRAEAIQCGIVEIAGRSVGAAYVGCVAATLVIAEVLRTLAGGQRFQELSYQLSNNYPAKVSRNNTAPLATNIGYIRA